MPLRGLFLVPLLLAIAGGQRLAAGTNGTFRSAVIGRPGTNTVIYEFSLFDGAQTNRKLVYQVNGSEKSPKKIVWIFPGYKPAGDPYLQNPEIYIKKWELENTAVRERAVFFIPDMGDSLYRTTPKKPGAWTDIQWLVKAFAYYNGEVPNDNILLIGVSTGAEGVLKFAGVLTDPPAVILLSGTYDLFSLQKGSGEYALHLRAFGNDQTVWTNENPISLLQKKESFHNRLKAYLFCEERSLYFMQAVELSTADIPGTQVSNLLSLGKGFGHGWDFWGNPRVVKTIRDIIGKN